MRTSTVSKLVKNQKDQQSHGRPGEESEKHHNSYPDREWRTVRGRNHFGESFAVIRKRLVNGMLVRRLIDGSILSEAMIEYECLRKRARRTLKKSIRRQCCNVPSH